MAELMVSIHINKQRKNKTIINAMGENAVKGKKNDQNTWAQL